MTIRFLITNRQIIKSKNSNNKHSVPLLESKVAFFPNVLPEYEKLRNVSPSKYNFVVPQFGVRLDHPVQIVDDVSEVVEKKASVNVVARTCKLTDTTLSVIVDRIQHRKPPALSIPCPASSFTRPIRVPRFAFVRFRIVKLGSSFHGFADTRIQRRVISQCWT